MSDVPKTRAAYDALRRTIERHDRLYYVEAQPEISDRAYDALFAALVVTQALADGREWAVGADTAGVAAAGVAAWRGASVIVVVAIAASLTAGLRAAGLA